MVQRGIEVGVLLLEEVLGIAGVRSCSTLVLTGATGAHHFTSNTLPTALKTRVKAGSVVYTDSLASCNILDVSGLRHHRVNHSQAFVGRHGDHINGIENPWNQSRRILRKHNGIPRKDFFLFLKECEFRLNYGTPGQQLAAPRIRPYL